jgi:flagellar motility protein MotE (MotC chaperone)
MNKKMIILIAGIGLIGLSGGFVFAWISRPKPAAETEPNTATHEPNTAPIVTDLANIRSGAYMNADVNNAAFRKAMTEKQLKQLVQSMRVKMVDVQQKEQELAAKEQQLDAVKNLLQKDVDDLTALKVELAAAAAAVKQERDKLGNLRLQITQEEMVNLKKTASIYDKMDTASGSKIMAKMCESNQADDAVKILNYMTERTAAKMLGEIGTADPNLAADLCERLKKIKETK